MTRTAFLLFCLFDAAFFAGLLAVGAFLWFVWPPLVLLYGGAAFLCVGILGSLVCLSSTRSGGPRA